MSSSLAFTKLWKATIDLFKYLVTEVKLSYMVSHNWTNTRLESTMICPHNQMSRGSTLQHKAAYHGYDLMLYFLGELGADTNA